MGPRQLEPLNLTIFQPEVFIYIVVLIPYFTDANSSGLEQPPWANIIRNSPYFVRLMAHRTEIIGCIC